MALRFFDGADHYSTAQINRKWTTNVAGAVVAGGRRGTSALQMSNGKSYTKIIDNQPTWVVGFSLKLLLNLPFGTGPLVALIDNVTTQMDLCMDTSGHLVVRRNG